MNKIREKTAIKIEGNKVVVPKKNIYLKSDISKHRNKIRKCSLCGDVLCSKNIIKKHIKSHEENKDEVNKNKIMNNESISTSGKITEELVSIKWVIERVS